MSLPTDAAARKRLQLYTFMFKYFPDAWLAVVDVARVGNEQHNPGEPLHWAREKSKDQMNAAFNHMFDYGMGLKKDTDECWHLAKSIWRQMAQLQLDIEADRAAATPSVPKCPVCGEPDGKHWIGCSVHIQNVYSRPTKSEYT